MGKGPEFLARQQAAQDMTRWKSSASETFSGSLPYAPRGFFSSVTETDRPERESSLPLKEQSRISYFLDATRVSWEEIQRVIAQTSERQLPVELRWRVPNENDPGHYLVRQIGEAALTREVQEWTDLAGFACQLNKARAKIRVAGGELTPLDSLLIGAVNFLGEWRTRRVAKRLEDLGRLGFVRRDSEEGSSGSADICSGWLRTAGRIAAVPALAAGVAVPFMKAVSIREAITFENQDYLQMVRAQIQRIEQDWKMAGASAASTIAGRVLISIKDNEGKHPRWARRLGTILFFAGLSCLVLTACAPGETVSPTTSSLRKYRRRISPRSFELV
jgi:hypothetical protein